jgi:GntR family transcriptional regulator, transcriptional repressor for pyruvate dehydrogenase complex
MFQTIKPHKITEEIVDQIKELIRTGELLPGDKLPPERELSRIFGVGRSSLREAISILDNMGLVEMKPRRGNFVRQIKSPDLRDPILRMLEEDSSRILELYELRKDIELAAAEQAALRRTTRDLQLLGSALEQMEQSLERGEMVVADERRFHLSLARASKNYVRTHVLSVIFDISHDHFLLVYQKFIEDGSHLSEIFQQHKQVFQAIEAQDPKAAVAAMNEHLSVVEKHGAIFG